MSPLLGDALLHAQSDERLARLAAEGRERAFATLVERHRAGLLRHARHVVGADEAEDVVQQALAQAWGSLVGGTQVVHVRGWLFQIVRHVCWKTAAERAATGRVSPELIGSAGADADSENRLAARDVVAHMAALPENQRAALVQTVLEGRSRREVARNLGLSEGAVRQLVHRARSTLRAAASAIIPLPLVQWAAGGAGTTAPTMERVGELLGGAGAAGALGMLAKAGVVAVTAGAVAAGTVATVQQVGPHARVRPAATASAGQASMGSPATMRSVSVAATSASAATGSVAERRAARRRAAGSAGSPSSGGERGSVSSGGSGRHQPAPGDPSPGSGSGSGGGGSESPDHGGSGGGESTPTHSGPGSGSGSPSSGPGGGTPPVTPLPEAEDHGGSGPDPAPVSGSGDGHGGGDDGSGHHSGSGGSGSDDDPDPPGD